MQNLCLKGLPLLQTAVNPIITRQRFLKLDILVRQRNRRLVVEEWSCMQCALGEGIAGTQWLVGCAELYCPAQKFLNLSHLLHKELEERSLILKGGSAPSDATQHLWVC